GPKATIHACTLENDSWVGAGATIMDGSKVARGAVVAPGSLVPPGATIPAGQLWAGTPAAYVRDVSESESAAAFTLSAETQSLSVVHAAECAKAYEDIELDERKWLEKESRDPTYPFPSPEEGTTMRPDYDVLGKGIPGRVFDSNLRTPDIPEEPEPEMEAKLAKAEAK
ncbi:unnamed protein product, partial [Discosporangium mesarthrocarpum]